MRKILSDPRVCIAFPFIVFGCALLGAYLVPYVNKNLYPQYFFAEYEELPVIERSVQLIEKAKAQFLSSNEPRWLALYAKLVESGVQVNADIDFSLRGADREKVAQWVVSENQIAAGAAAFLLADVRTPEGRTFIKENLFAESPAVRRAALRSLQFRDRHRTAAPAIAHELFKGMRFNNEEEVGRALEMLDFLRSILLVDIAEEIAKNIRTIEFQKSFYERGITLPPDNWGFSGRADQPIQFFLGTISNWDITRLEPGLTWNKIFMEKIPVTVELVSQLAEPRRNRGLELTELDKIEFLASANPYLQYVGLLTLRDAEQKEQSFTTHQARMMGSGWSAPDENGVRTMTRNGQTYTQEGPLPATLDVSRWQQRWQRNTAAKKVFLFDLLTNISIEDFQRISRPLRFSIYSQAPFEMLRARRLRDEGNWEEIETAVRKIERRLDELKLDERSPAFAIPDEEVVRKELPRLYDEARELALAYPHSFQALWPAVKLSFYVNDDHTSLEFLYLCDGDPRNRARMLSFALRQEITESNARLYLSMLRSYMLMASQPEYLPVKQAVDQLLTEEIVKALLSCVYEIPSMAYDEDERMAVETLITHKAKTLDNMLEIWPGRESSTVEDMANTWLFGQVQHEISILPDAKKIERLLQLQELTVSTEVKLWTMLELVRADSTVDSTLAWEQRYVYPDLALEIIYRMDGVEKFSYEELLCHCYYSGASGRVMLQNMFNEEITMEDHDFIETIIVDLAEYNTVDYSYIRKAAIQKAEWLQEKIQDIWGFPGVVEPPETPLTEWQLGHQTGQQRREIKDIESSDAVEEFWAFYAEKPEVVWGMKPENSGPRIMMRFINNPESDIDQESMLNEMLEYTSADIWVKTIAAEKEVHDGDPEDVTEFPVTTIPILSTRPTIDGHVTEEEWGDAVVITPQAKEYVGAEVSTEVFLGYTQEGLYIAWKAEDDQNRIEAQEYDMSGKMFKRESIFFFLDLQRQYRLILDLGVDYWGNLVLTDFASAATGGLINNNIPIEWHDGAWHGEVFFTWTEMQTVCPESDSCGRLNFRRNQVVGGNSNTYQWAEMPRNPYQPEYYGFIVFE